MGFAPGGSRLEPILPFLLFVGVFGVYAYCAYPTIAPRDSADMAVAAMSLGVAHPPGYPFYAVLGRAWISLLPFGEPAYRLNLLSAAAGAGAAAFVYLLTRPMTGSLAGVAAALSLAFSHPMWKFSLLGEKYSLHALFIAALLWLSSGGSVSLLRRAAMSGLLLGLGIVNHQSLLFLLPALLYLWTWELRRHGQTWRAVAVYAGIPFLLGLSLQAVVWIRLGDARLAWSVLTRSEYGTFQLFAGFARDMTPSLAAGLTSHLLSGLWTASGGLLAASALLGFHELRRADPRFGMGLLLAFLAFGPFFFLLTRFDLSEWVARSVLESAFVAPLIPLALAAAFGIRAVERRWAWAGLPLALACAAAPVWLHGGGMNRRADFSALQYARDLRSSVPAGGAAVIGGDTALFALRYLDRIEPDGVERLFVGSREPGLRGWIEERLRTRPVFVHGLPEQSLEALGLMGNPHQVWPAGLVQRVLPRGSRGRSDREAWESLHPPMTLDSDSYAHDIRLAYAFAHYLSGRLYERLGLGDPSGHYAAAARLDPEDYQIEPVSAP